MFDALSLVVSPEEKGVPTATIELMETQNKGDMMRLLETALTEQGHAEEEVHYHKLGEDTEKHLTTCGLGSVYNPVSGKCEPIPEVAANIDEISQHVTIAQLLEIYDKILCFADHNVISLQKDAEQVTQLKEAVENITEVTHTLRSLTLSMMTQNRNEVKETSDTDSRLELLETKLDNLTFKLKGTTKQKQPNVVSETENLEADKLPYK